MNAPEVVGPFQILGEIGRGSMGTVYLARKGGGTELGRPVALKRLHPEHVRDLQNLKAFVREAEIGICLNHHNVVAVQELIPDGDGYAITMEFVDGVDLRRILRYHNSLGQRMPLTAALEILEQTCLGLDHAHQADPTLGRPPLIHRDLKPANVMVTRSGLVKVMDFGIARLAEGHLLEDGTAGGTIKGTPRYMSPEQARGATVTQESDLFSAGLVLFECVVGERFYDSTDFLGLLREAQEADVPNRLRPAGFLPKPLLAVLKRALEPAPSRRYSRGIEMAEDLAACRRKVKEDVPLRVYAARISDALAPPNRTDGTVVRAPGDDSGGGARAQATPSVSTLARGFTTLSQAALADTAARAAAAAASLEAEDGASPQPPPAAVTSTTLATASPRGQAGTSIGDRAAAASGAWPAAPPPSAGSGAWSASPPSASSGAWPAPAPPPPSGAWPSAPPAAASGAWPAAPTPGASPAGTGATSSGAFPEAPPPVGHGGAYGARTGAAIGDRRGVRTGDPAPSGPGDDAAARSGALASATWPADPAASPGGASPAPPPAEPAPRPGEVHARPTLLIAVTLVAAIGAIVAWGMVLMQPEGGPKPILLYVDPSSATVSIGGQPLTTARPYRLPPPPAGRALEVVVTAEGYLPRSERFEPSDSGKARLVTLDKPSGP